MNENVVILALGLGLLIMARKSAQTENSRYKKRADAQLLSSQGQAVIDTSSAMSRIECAVKCKDADGCHTFVYAEDTGSCQTVGAVGEGGEYVYSDGDIAYTDVSCVDGRMLNNICYRIIESPGSTESAFRAMCTNIGATVAAIRNEAIFNFVQTYHNDVTVYWLFIDGSDEITEGTWVYSDGTPMSYTNWRSDQPDGGTNANMVVLDGSDQMFDVGPSATAGGVVCVWE